MSPKEEKKSLKAKQGSTAAFLTIRLHIETGRAKVQSVPDSRMKLDKPVGVALCSNSILLLSLYFQSLSSAQKPRLCGNANPGRISDQRNLCGTVAMREAILPSNKTF